MSSWGLNPEPVPTTDNSPYLTWGLDHEVGTDVISPLNVVERSGTSAYGAPPHATVRDPYLQLLEGNVYKTCRVWRRFEWVVTPRSEGDLEGIWLQNDFRPTPVSSQIWLRFPPVAADVDLGLRHVQRSKCFSALRIENDFTKWLNANCVFNECLYCRVLNEKYFG